MYTCIMTMQLLSVCNICVLHIRAMCNVSIQMVSLCKDPEGSNVFGDPSTQDQKLSTIQKIARPEPSQDNELTSLRKRIAELENEITMNS